MAMYVMYLHCVLLLVGIEEIYGQNGSSNSTDSVIQTSSSQFILDVSSAPSIFTSFRIEQSSPIPVYSASPIAVSSLTGDLVSSQEAMVTGMTTRIEQSSSIAVSTSSNAESSMSKEFISSAQVIATAILTSTGHASLELFPSSMYSSQAVLSSQYSSVLMSTQSTNMHVLSSTDLPHSISVVSPSTATQSSTSMTITSNFTTQSPRSLGIVVQISLLNLFITFVTGYVILKE
ncbi:Hypothetical predicted protein [Mytilus galloprovincialis]|uniref:Uncharacterized protein n=2 Tax=Mytilus galloprovincialis TaxID=29158 RepID=A0A8B6DSB5_MYTGA|nr:Hypothetical predicted protein [Mytilus galloprovincialis]